MAANAGTLEADFRINLNKLKQDLSQATRLVNQSVRSAAGSTGRGGGFGSGTGFQGRFESMFARHPGMRAERALGGSMASLIQGDIGGAVAGLATKMTGLGLLLGAGVGAGIEVFKGLKASIVETDKAAEKLRATVARPLALQANLSPEGIGKEIGSTGAQLSSLKEKRKSSYQQSLGFIGRHAGVFNFGPWGALGSAAASREGELSQSQNEAQIKLKQLLGAQADAELQEANIRAGEVGQENKHPGEMAAIRLKYKHRLAELGLEAGLNQPGRDQTVLFKQMAALKEDEQTDLRKVGMEELKDQYKYWRHPGLLRKKAREDARWQQFMAAKGNAYMASIIGPAGTPHYAGPAVAGGAAAMTGAAAGSPSAAGGGGSSGATNPASKITELGSEALHGLHQVFDRVFEKYWGH